LAWLAHILLVHQVTGGGLEVEGLLWVVNNLEEGLVFELLGHCVDLIFERGHSWVIASDQFVGMAHNYNFLFGLHGLLGQVAGLVVKEAVGVTGPGNSFHQNSAHN
jgi:hypothetical protein